VVESRLDPTSPLPRYYQIYGALLARIKTGELKAGEALPSERQIAEQYGVARLTVVKALDLLTRDNLIDKQHGRGTFVLPQPEEDLETIAFIKAGGLVQSELKGISETAFEQNYQLQVLAVDLVMNKVQAYLNACIDNGVKGLIIYALPGYEDMNVYCTLLKQGIPMVMIDRFYSELETDYVVYDDEKSAYQLTEKLVQRGHQRIAIIPGFEVQATAVQNRLVGHYKALKKHKIQVQEELTWLELYNSPHVFRPNAPFNERERYRSRLLEKLTETKPTAILTINDGIHEHLVADLNALESSTRDETFALELATFSYRHLPETRHLKLLALQPGEVLGQEAARLLISRLEGERRKQGPKHITVPMEILELGPQQNVLGQKKLERKERIKQR
jgi:GntR family transcriptional regulator, arabinose operon transcriptional repressor